MDKQSKHDKVKKQLPAHVLFYAASITVLIAGMVCTAFIFISAANNDIPDLDLENSKAYQFQLEKIGGKSAVFGVQLTHWFSSLWHGKPLAYTVAVLSIIAAIILCWLGNRQEPYEE